MNTKCRVPLMRLCDSDSRIKIQLNDCDPDSCNPEATQLCLTKQGCTEYETVCVEEEVSHGCGGCPSIISKPKWIEVEKEKPFVCYPILEIDIDGNAVFALDDTLKSFGYGRYSATLYFNDCACLHFDVDYVCGVPKLGTISTDKFSACGAD